jgi:NAD(P)-dependent dehydrogenase (short-subunit alcohol dehydrogenase family)
MKNVLITGAGGHLGRACLREFTGSDFHIIAIVSPGKKNSIPPPFTGSVHEINLTDEGQVNDRLEEVIHIHSSIDIALLLVGGFEMGDISQAGSDQLKRMMSLNFDATYYTARKLFAHMAGQKNGGRIVMVGSRPALEPQGGKSALAYALSKSLIFKLAELLNAEGKDKNVVCSIIVPSVIDTPENRTSMPKSDPSRWVKADEIAAIIKTSTTGPGEKLRDPVIKIYGMS